MVEGRVCKEKKGKVWACDSSPPKIGTICRLECEGDKVGGCFFVILFCCPSCTFGSTEDLSTFFFADLGDGKFESVYAHWLGSFSPETWVQSLLYFMKRDFQTIKIVLMNFTRNILLLLLCQANSTMCPKSLSQPKRQADQPRRMVTYSIIIFGLWIFLNSCTVFS